MVSPPLAEEGKLILPSNLELEETGPGYQDRTFSRSGKFHRYYELLLKDLEDYPNDPRTLYYLGDSCFGKLRLFGGFSYIRHYQSPHDNFICRWV